jgi:hypothetical protein
MRETQYRIYPDNLVIHEDDFNNVDRSGSLSDDFITVSVPDVVVDFIVESSRYPVPQFFTNRARDFYNSSKEQQNPKSQKV